MSDFLDSYMSKNKTDLLGNVINDGSTNSLANSLLDSPSTGFSFDAFPNLKAASVKIGTGESEYDKFQRMKSLDEGSGGADSGNLFGMSNNTLSGIADLGNLGLGIASFLDQKKTSKIAREQMRLNIDKFKQDQANFKTTRTNFNKVSANG